MYIINIDDAEKCFDNLITRTLAGEEVYLTRANEPIIRMIAIEHDTSPRIGGFWARQIQYSDDWDNADSELAAMMSRPD